jgi:phosphonate transport system permease protein
MDDTNSPQKFADSLPRFPRQPIFRWVTTIALIFFLVGALKSVEFDGQRVMRGAGRIAQIVDEMFPPKLTRFPKLLEQAVVTLQIASLGTLMGVVASLILGRYTCRHTSRPWRSFVLRGVVGGIRTIPELIWGLLFVAAFGLGPLAGMLAVAADTFGFCGRFFTEAFDDIEDRELEGLRSLSVSSSGLFFAMIIPRSFPALVHTSLYALERSVRASIVLGLVGAGGIGVELDVAMRLFRYDEASTIMLIILVMVLTIEQISEWIRVGVRRPIPA